MFQSSNSRRKAPDISEHAAVSDYWKSHTGNTLRSYANMVAAALGKPGAYPGAKLQRAAGCQCLVGLG